MLKQVQYDMREDHTPVKANIRTEDRVLGTVIGKQRTGNRDPRTENSNHNSLSCSSKPEDDEQKLVKI